MSWHLSSVFPWHLFITKTNQSSHINQFFWYIINLQSSPIFSNSINFKPQKTQQYQHKSHLFPLHYFPISKQIISQSNHNYFIILYFTKHFTKSFYIPFLIAILPSVIYYTTLYCTSVLFLSVLLYAALLSNYSKTIEYQCVLVFFFYHQNSNNNLYNFLY